MQISVAGIGAVGALEAPKLVLWRLPSSSSLAFASLQPLDPKHHSDLAEILAGISTITVEQAADGVVVEPNHLYVILPDEHPYPGEESQSAADEALSANAKLQRLNEELEAAKKRTLGN